MSEISTKPYFLRAIYEWCIDSGFTPYISVKVDETTRVPTEYVKNGEIVLNISAQATRSLTMSNDLIQFSARFSGMSREISIPVARVAGVFARENGHGAFFQVEDTQASSANNTGNASASAQLGLGANLPPAPARPAMLAVAEPAPAVSEATKSGDDKPDSGGDKKPGRAKLTVIK
jgi:stringent starvation protein B